MNNEIPPVLTDAECDEIIDKGVPFDHPPTTMGQVFRRIQRDADVKWYKERGK